MMNYEDLAKNNITSVTYFVTFDDLTSSTAAELVKNRFKSAERKLDSYANVVFEEHWDQDNNLRRRVERKTDGGGRVIEVIEGFDDSIQRFSYVYEGEKVMKEIQHYEAGGMDITEYTWEGDNLTLKKQMDEDGEEAFKEVLIYDDQDQLKEMENYRWGEKEFSIEYERDDQGRVAKEIHANSEDYIEQELAFEYDDKDQVIKVITTDENDNVVREEEHQYDDNGFRTKTIETYSMPGRPSQSLEREYVYEKGE